MNIRHQNHPAENLSRVRDIAIAEARVLARNRACIRALARTLDRANARAFDLDIALLYARDLATYPDPDINLATDIANVHDHDHASDLASDLASAVNRAFDSVLGFKYVRANARALVRDLAHDPDRACGFNCSRDFARDLAHDVTRARDCARALHRAHDLIRVRGLADALVGAAEQAQHLASRLDTAAQSDAQLREQRASRAAGYLIELNVRLLPRQHRSRYRQEFQAELLSLADAGASRWSRVMYAGRQFSRVLELRASLLAPGEPRLFRSYRMACWILSSEWRTWGLLGPLMALAAVNVFLQQGWGSAFYTLPGVVAFFAGVEWLRKRWGISVKRRSQTGSPDSK
ncbi:hypothetical protein ACFWYW_33580 [Nonomuraea sp. NPDC059023]|uniref:hypothetical protein n=1 Tax=unclassified Nonomuraea TaxID=2593643 RepID=UPI0036A35FA1